MAVSRLSYLGSLWAVVLRWHVAGQTPHGELRSICKGSHSPQLAAGCWSSSVAPQRARPPHVGSECDWARFGQFPLNVLNV